MPPLWFLRRLGTKPSRKDVGGWVQVVGFVERSQGRILPQLQLPQPGGSGRREGKPQQGNFGHRVPKMAQEEGDEEDQH